MSDCKNCGKPVRQRPGEIPTHGNGFVYCNVLDFHDKRVAQFATEQAEE